MRYLSHSAIGGTALLCAAGLVRAAGSYSTGFESPFTVGPIGTQQGWSAFGDDSAVLPRIATTGGTFAGTQHLILGDPINGATGNTTGVLSPILSSVFITGETAVINLKFKVGGGHVGGADYFVEGFDSVSGKPTFKLILSDYGAFGDGRGVISVRNNFATSGVLWPLDLDVYRDVRIEQTLGGITKYYYGGTLIYTNVITADANFSTARLDRVRLSSDGYQDVDTGYVDNFSIAPIPEPAAAGLAGIGALGFGLRRSRR